MLTPDYWLLSTWIEPSPTYTTPPPTVTRLSAPSVTVRPTSDLARPQHLVPLLQHVQPRPDEAVAQQVPAGRPGRAPRRRVLADRRAERQAEHPGVRRRVRRLRLRREQVDRRVVVPREVPVHRLGDPARPPDRLQRAQPDVQERVAGRADLGRRLGRHVRRLQAQQAGQHRRIAVRGRLERRARAAPSSAPPTTPSPASAWTPSVPIPSSSRRSVLPRWRASTNDVPTTGCPANGSSRPGVKIRTRASAEGSVGGRTNVVSEKFISRAMACISSSASPWPSWKTAS